MAIKTNANVNANKTKKVDDQPKKEYTFKVLKVRPTDKAIGLDLEINGVVVSGCWYRCYTRKDGSEGSMVSLPQTKGADGKYYNIVFVPISTDTVVNVIEPQIQALLDAQQK